MQAAISVTCDNPPLRLQAPSNCPPLIAEVSGTVDFFNNFKLMEKCFSTIPEQRPDFSTINDMVQNAEKDAWKWKR